jgi:hypothetical protein
MLRMCRKQFVWRSLEPPMKEAFQWLTGAVNGRQPTAVAIGAGLCLLFYEHGGIGKNDNVAVFRMPDGRAEASFWPKRSSKPRLPRIESIRAPELYWRAN